MDKYKPTAKERVSELLFNTTFGSILIFLMCFVLFVTMFGVGYIGMGIFLLLKSIQKSERTGEPYPGGSAGIGSIILWPVAVTLIILDED